MTAATSGAGRASGRRTPRTRPYVTLSVAMSLDGCIDDVSADRLLLSGPEDFARVDALRAASDAVLIGRGTLESDNPRLLVRAAELRGERLARGEPEHPLRVVLTSRPSLDRDLRLWHTGGERVVYTTESAAPALRRHLGSLAQVVAVGRDIELPAVLADLAGRGVDRLMVEGGSAVHTAFLAAGLADEAHVAVAPLLVGQPDAPRFPGPAEYPGGPRRRFTLLGCEAVGDVALMRFAFAPSRDGQAENAAGGGAGAAQVEAAGAAPAADAGETEGAPA